MQAWLYEREWEDKEDLDNKSNFTVLHPRAIDIARRIERAVGLCG